TRLSYHETEADKVVVANAPNASGMCEFERIQSSQAQRPSPFLLRKHTKEIRVSPLAHTKFASLRLAVAIPWGFESLLPHQFIRAHHDGSSGTAPTSASRSEGQ